MVHFRRRSSSKWRARVPCKILRLPICIRVCCATTLLSHKRCFRRVTCSMPTPYRDCLGKASVPVAGAATDLPPKGSAPNVALPNPTCIFPHANNHSHAETETVVVGASRTGMCASCCKLRPRHSVRNAQSCLPPLIKLFDLSQQNFCARRAPMENASLTTGTWLTLVRALKGPSLSTLHSFSFRHGKNKSSKHSVLHMLNTG